MLNDAVLTPPEPSAKNGGKILEPSHLSFRLFRVRTCVRKMALEKDAYNISFQFWFFATLHFEKKKIVSYRNNELTFRNDQKNERVSFSHERFKSAIWNTQLPLVVMSHQIYCKIRLKFLTTTDMAISFRMNLCTFLFVDWNINFIRQSCLVHFLSPNRPRLNTL